MLFVIATNLGAGVLAFCLGMRVRGLIPLRSPSNAVRLENAETDKESVVIRATTDKELAEILRDQRRAELETELIEVRARQVINEAAGVAATDDDVGTLIATCRGRAKLSQRSVMVGTGITIRRLSEIEHGQEATLAELQRLSRYLGLEFVPATLRVPLDPRTRPADALALIERSSRKSIDVAAEEGY